MKSATCFLMGRINRRLFLLSVGAWLFLTSPSLAIDPPCADLRTQTDMNICARNQAKTAEAELEKTLHLLSGKLRTKEGKKHLRQTMQAWRSYRTKQCAFETLGTLGGSVHSLVQANCYEEMAADQTKRLRYQLDCQEGDLSCGGQ